jgi:predicted aspartyl protease
MISTRRLCLAISLCASSSAALGIPPIMSPSGAAAALGLQAAGSQIALPQDDVDTRRDRIGRIIAPVMINGQGPYSFMLDTGANQTVLSDVLLAKLQLTANPDVRVSVSGITGSEMASSVHIDHLDAGELHLSDITLAVLAGPVLSGLDGILGMDGLAGLRLSADLLRNRMTISHSHGRYSDPRYSVVAVEFLSERLLLTEAQVGRVRVKAVIDTGSMHTLGNKAMLAALINKHQEKDRSGELAQHAEVIDVTEVSQFGLIGRVSSIQLGGATVRDLDVTFGDFPIFKSWQLQDQPALLIGMDVLGTLDKVSIDYRRKEVGLLPHGRGDMSVVKKYFSFDTW